MKTLMTLFFSAFCLFATAQTFNEQTFMDIMERGDKDRIKFLQTETTPDFMLLGTGGYVTDLKGYITLNEGASSVIRTFSNVKVRQYDKTGVATGIVKHIITLKKGGEPIIINELFTDVFVEQKGKWLLVSAQHSEGPTDLKQDEAAIKKVVEAETTAWNAADVKAHAACWQIQPYSRGLITLADGSHFDVSADMMKTTNSSGMGNGATSVNTNYLIHVSGNTAWTTYDEVTTPHEGNKWYSHEMRQLERINGVWKIVGMSAHIYKPK